jgi:Domain of unknown function (DUF4365)
MFPKAPPNLAQERLGITAVALAAARLGLIWRETLSVDVGIDGHLEFVDADGHATGQLVAVQVKSGSSYFATEDAQSWRFSPQAKHRAYWEHYPLPVLLVLYSPENDSGYWVDARRELRNPGGSGSIAVPKANVLAKATAAELFEGTGTFDRPYVPDLRDVLATLVKSHSGNASFPVSHFDLFSLGLTNICRSIYFGMDLAMTIAEFNLAESEFGVGFGDQEHEFLFNFIVFLLAQRLAYVDYSDCLIDWQNRQMQAHFVAPLTSRGRDLVALVGAEEDRLVAEGVLQPGQGLRVAQEAFFEMVPISYFRRLPRITQFRQVQTLRSSARACRP